MLSVQREAGNPRGHDFTAGAAYKPGDSVEAPLVKCNLLARAEILLCLQQNNPILVVLHSHGNITSARGLIRTVICIPRETVLVLVARTVQLAQGSKT